MQNRPFFFFFKPRVLKTLKRDENHTYHVLKIIKLPAGMKYPPMTSSLARQRGKPKVKILHNSVNNVIENIHQTL